MLWSQWMHISIGKMSAAQSDSEANQRLIRYTVTSGLWQGLCGRLIWEPVILNSFSNDLEELITKLAWQPI